MTVLMTDVIVYHKNKYRLCSSESFYFVRF